MKNIGRPLKSEIRQNLVEILFFKKKAFGYELHKIYNKIFPKCTSRVVYYHLRKGAQMNIFKITEIISERGDFSWGYAAERIYYELGHNAAPIMDERVKIFFDNLKSKDDNNGDGNGKK